MKISAQSRVLLKVVLSKVGQVPMSTNKSPLYLPWLLIICVSDEIVVTL
jgi:hypothetical protein